MKTIVSISIILSVLLFAANCAQINSAQVSQNANAQAIKTSTSPPNDQMTDSLPEVSRTDNTIQAELVDEFVEEIEMPAVPKYAMRLLMNAEYYKEEVENDIGFHKDWLGLYRKNNRYFLLPSIIEIKAVNHYLRDEKDSKEKTGREVSSNIKLPNVFLLKNARMLREGEVETVFYGNEENSESINRKYRRKFDFKGKKYTLTVEDPTAEEGEWLTEKSKIVISQGETKQTIYQTDRCSDCSWDLCWVGDLDKDGKLDFLFNLNGHYNSTCHRLFLSSQAEKGEILRDVAEICQQGC